MTRDFHAQRFWLAGIMFGALWLVAPNAAVAQADGPTLAHKYIASDKGVKSLSGYGSDQTKDGRTIIGGDVMLPTSKDYEGVRWRGCVNSDGRVAWAARAEEQPAGESFFLLATDGDSIWEIGALKSGLFRAAKFEAKSLRKETSVQMAFAPITTPASYVAFETVEHPDFDLQVSMVQPVRDSVRVALFSSDLQLIFDKLYPLPVGSVTEAAKTLASAYVRRLPDRSGYYLFLRYPLRANPEAKPGICIIRLANDGSVRWANSYAIGYDQFEVAPHVCGDGAILITPWGLTSNGHSIVIKIAQDGTPAWAIDTEGSGADLADFSGALNIYKFTDPYLFLTGGQIGSARLFSFLFAVNYQTGKIEKQIKFASSGGAGFVEKTNDSLYVSLLDSLGANTSKAALLRFDFDLKLRAARSIRNAEPHWPLLNALRPGKLFFSYCFESRKTLVLETVDENFNSPSSCDVLEKADFSFVKSNVEVKPVGVVATQLPGIKVSDANGKRSEADLRLVSLALNSTECDRSTPR